MAMITALKASRGRKKLVKVFLDGKFAFNLDAEVSARERLQGGQELDSSRIEELARADRFQRCHNAAAHYLGYRPRSEREMRQRLLRHRFLSETVEAVLKRLKEQALLDDMAFALFWRDNRQSFSPRSQRLVRLELRQKGVDGDIIDRVVATIDDADNAYRAATGKARRLSPSDYESFRRRLGAYLGRRGFGYGVIKETIERLWQETGSRLK